MRATLLMFALLLVAAILIRRQAEFLVGPVAGDGAGHGMPSQDLSGAVEISIGDEIGAGVDASGGAVPLTFDDGPHPIYTDQILEVLARHGVRATFFVIGKEVLNLPDTTRDIVDGGHELGNHTHPHYPMGPVRKVW